MTIITQLMALVEMYVEIWSNGGCGHGASEAIRIVVFQTVLKTIFVNVLKLPQSTFRHLKLSFRVPSDPSQIPQEKGYFHQSEIKNTDPLWKVTF